MRPVRVTVIAHLWVRVLFVRHWERLRTVSGRVKQTMHVPLDFRAVLALVYVCLSMDRAKYAQASLVHQVSYAIRPVENVLTPAGFVIGALDPTLVLMARSASQEMDAMFASRHALMAPVLLERAAKTASACLTMWVVTHAKGNAVEARPFVLRQRGVVVSADLARPAMMGRFAIHKIGPARCRVCVKNASTTMAVPIVQDARYVYQGNASHVCSRVIVHRVLIAIHKPSNV